MEIINVDTTKELPRVLSLCTGYGGLEIGLERSLGEINVLAHVEIEAFAIANLVDKMEAGQMVPAPIWTDLKTFNARIFRGSVDILTGGFPCQPFSCAGKQWGTDDPRHLWPSIEKTIKECGPRKVFFENVEGLISTKTLLHRPELLRYCRQVEQRLGATWGLAFRRRLTGLCGISVLQYVEWRLERLGYKCESGIFSAAEVGAPHRRKRVFILAESSDSRRGPTAITTEERKTDLRKPKPKGRIESGESSVRSEGLCCDELVEPENQRLQEPGSSELRKLPEKKGEGLVNRPQQPSNGEKLANPELRSGNAGGERTRREEKSNIGRRCEGTELEHTRLLGQEISEEQATRFIESGQELGDSESREKKRIPEQTSEREGMQVGGPSNDVPNSLSIRNGESHRIIKSGFPYENGEKWPAFRGQPQHEWEEPRIVDDSMC